MLFGLIFGCKNGNKESLNSKDLTAEEVYKSSSDKVAMVLCYKDGVPSSQGSGFFVDKNILVTNYHVIKGADKIELKIVGNETIFKGANVIKASPEFDLAIVQTKQNFEAFNIEKNVTVEVGAKIYTIGNPRGLEGTISEGIISGKREKDGVEFLQITAPISPGNSGGPVLDEEGNVIGVATFTFKNSQNLNFAMPIKYIDKCTAISELSSKETVTKSDSLAISLISYSKGWREDYQQASFCNNTNSTITSITGVFVYRRKMVEYTYDPHSIYDQYKNWKYWLGDIFHYQLFTVDVDIAPHMSKLVSINTSPELFVHKYCSSKKGCTGCGETSCIHYDVEFKLLSYEVDK